MTLEQFVVSLLFLGISFVLKMIFDRISKNENDLKEFKKDIDAKISANYDTIRDEYRGIRTMMEVNKKEILATVSRVIDGAVTETHCSAKQDLWGERFNNMMDKFDSFLEKNEKDHNDTIETMRRNVSARNAQMAELSTQIGDITDCIKSLKQSGMNT